MSKRSNMGLETSAASLANGSTRRLKWEGSTTSIGMPVQDVSTDDSYIITEAMERSFRPSLWLGFFCCIMFFIDYSIVSPTLYPYLLTFCGSVASYGWVQTTYGIAQILSSVIFGAWASKRTVKEALLVSLALLTIGNGLYGVAPMLVKQSDGHGGVCTNADVNLEVCEHNADTRSTLHVGVIIVFVARIISGFGGGVVTVAFGYFARVTQPQNRLKTFGFARSVMSIAFLGAPALGVPFSYFPCNGVARGTRLVNENTLPGLFAALFALALFGAVLCIFKNPPPAPPSKAVKFRVTRTMWTVLFLASVAAGVIAGFAILVVPETTGEFGWQDLDNSVLFAFVGAILIPFSALGAIVAMKFSVRASLLAGMVLLLVGGILEFLPQPEYHNLLDAWPFLISCLGVCGGYGMVSAMAPATMAQIARPETKQQAMAMIPFFTGIARVVAPVFVGYTLQTRSCAGIPYTLMCAGRLPSIGLVVATIVGIGTLLWNWDVVRTPGEIAADAEAAGDHSRMGLLAEDDRK